MDNNTQSKGAIRVALSCLGKARQGYGMDGVLVEPGRLVATDGHRLVCVETPEAAPDKPEGKALIVNGETLATAIKGAKVDRVAMNGSIQALDIHGRPLATYPEANVEGTFPDWRAVMPKAEAMAGGVTFKVNPGQLAGLLSAIQSASGYEPCVTIELPTPTAGWKDDPTLAIRTPIRITAKLANGERVTAALMPIQP